MAFINDYLSKDQVLILEKMGHYQFRWSEEYGCKRECTVDNDRKIWLIRIPRGYNWDPNERIDEFLLFIDEICKEKECKIFLKELCEVEDDDLLKASKAEAIWGWKIKKIEISKNIKYQNEKIIEILEKALKAFGINGSPKWNKPEFANVFQIMLKR